MLEYWFWLEWCLKGSLKVKVLNRGILLREGMLECGEMFGSWGRPHFVVKLILMRWF